MGPMDFFGPCEHTAFQNKHGDSSGVARRRLALASKQTEVGTMSSVCRACGHYEKVDKTAPLSSLRLSETDKPFRTG